MSLDSPFSIFGWDFRNSFRFSDNLNDFPQVFNVVNPADSSDRAKRVFAQNYRTTLDWDVGFALPSLLSNTWKLTPSLEIANVDLTLVEYFKESDSPDAFNTNVGFDIPFLLRINKDFNRNTFYSRIEADYTNVTDPLDVAVYQFDALDSTPAVEERSDFTRTEWFAKGTLGWKGPVLDAKASARIYEMMLDDEDLQRAVKEAVPAVALNR